MLMHGGLEIACESVRRAANSLVLNFGFAYLLLFGSPFMFNLLYFQVMSASRDME